jgi:phosphoglycolate phosphatase
MIKYVLFDFDGTLVDSREVFITAFNQIADKHNFKKIEPHNLQHLKTLSMSERFRFLQVPLYKMPLLTNEFLKLYRAQLPNIAFIEGIETVLEKTAALGLQIGILSSNAPDIIKQFLRNNKISHVTDVYSSSKLFGKHRVFRKFLKEKKLAAQEVLYVCDELRDITACNTVNIKPIWVSWGFELKEVMPQADLHTADTPEQLQSLVMSMMNDQ